MTDSVNVAALRELLVKLNLRFEAFDLFLIGDGSGMVGAAPCGWAVWSFHHDEGMKQITERFDSGGCTTGTNNYAELAPYLQMLWYYDSTVRSKKRILIVSDSKITVDCGNGTNDRMSNLSLWASVDCLVRQGNCITWKHIPRSSHRFNVEADKSSREVRNLFEKFTNK